MVLSFLVGGVLAPVSTGAAVVALVLPFAASDDVPDADIADGHGGTERNGLTEWCLQRSEGEQIAVSDANVNGGSDGSDGSGNH